MGIRNKMKKANKEHRTALVLEGGGLRGAYTAGALSWLVDNGISFDNAYGISTGAVYLLTYMKGSVDELRDFSVDYIRDRNVIGALALLRSGRIVNYDYLFRDILFGRLGYDLEPMKKNPMKAFIGLYDLQEGKTVYIPVSQIDEKLVQASTTLPILGKIVECGGREYLDGGITDMIPIERAVQDGCDRCLVITTKPADYVRKPAKGVVVSLMKRVYPQCANISADYRIRHLNYRKQIDLIKKLGDEGKAAYICPSRHSNATRLGGSREDLMDLFELGRKDMEDRKEEVLSLLGYEI